MTDVRPGEHAHLMDRIYRRQRHIYDLTRKYYLFGRDRLIRGLDLRSGESLIEVGCGTARNLLAIARRYPDTRLFGLDASGEMLRSAQENIAQAAARGAPSSGIVLRQGLAENLQADMFDLNGAKFDHALFSYSLSMIPDWPGALAAAAASVKPEGFIHIVDFADLAELGSIGGGLLRRWLGLFHVRPREEIVRRVEGGGIPADGEFWIAPGRYCFSLRCRPGDLGRYRLPSVAEQSHLPGNR